MDLLEVPKLYQCFLTRKLIQDPVVFVPKGQIYDRTSLDIMFEEQINEKNVLPLPDLKAAINQYQQLFCNSKSPEEVSEANQLEESSTTSGLANIAKKYENKLKDVQSEAEVVSVAFKELQTHNTQVKSEAKNLNAELEKFNQMARELELDVNQTVEDILGIRNRFVKKGVNVCLSIDRECELLSDLAAKKNYFETQLVSLEKKEEQLENLRQELQQLFGNLQVQANLSTKFEASSKKYREAEQINENQSSCKRYREAEQINEIQCSNKKYREAEKINENQFEQLLKNRCVRNKSIHVESQEIFKDIQVQGQVHLTNLSFTNAMKGAVFIRLLVNDPNTAVNIENCQFSGIGLILKDKKNKKQTDIILKNVQVKNAPQLGISIVGSIKSSFQNVQVNTCSGIGIYMSAIESNMEDVHVRNCKQYGVYINEIAKPMNMRNCSISNCAYYGLQMRSGLTVTGLNVVFENNVQGNVYRKFVQE